eukprot:2113235-Lingulodinium_polyedra.AAC.1
MSTCSGKYTSSERLRSRRAERWPQAWNACRGPNQRTHTGRPAPKRPPRPRSRTSRPLSAR